MKLNATRGKELFFSRFAHLPHSESPTCQDRRGDEARRGMHSPVRSSFRLGAALLVGLIIFGGCAAVPMAWRSDPPAAAIDAQPYRIQFEPIRKDGSHFEAFLLTIDNRSTVPIEIDWLQTRYVAEGNMSGRFLYKGVTAANFHQPPTEIVPPGETLEKKLWPSNLMGVAPLRSTTVRPGEPGFSAGVIPAGRNGIELIMKVGGQTTIQRLMVTVISEK